MSHWQQKGTTAGKERCWLHAFDHTAGESHSSGCLQTSHCYLTYVYINFPETTPPPPPQPINSHQTDLNQTWHLKQHLPTRRAPGMLCRGSLLVHGYFKCSWIGLLNYSSVRGKMVSLLLIPFQNNVHILYILGIILSESRIIWEKKEKQVVFSLESFRFELVEGA